jgi:hypothetical protein
MKTFAVLLFGAVVCLAEVRGQVIAPPAPSEYHVELRYVINAAGNQRLAQFFALSRYLRSIGFVADKGGEGDAEDPADTRMSGTIATANVWKLLEDAHIKSLLLMPPGFQLPADPATPVKVRLSLISGLTADRQKVLNDQVLDKLALLGFREAIGYDHHHHTQIVGWVPAGRLDQLLEDIRWEPTGWLAPAAPTSLLPTPLRGISPILATTVIPQSPPAGAIVPSAANATVAGSSWKIDPDVKKLAQDASTKRIRLEVLLSWPPSQDEREWRRDLRAAAPALTIEGRLGVLVTATMPAAAVTALADLPIVSGIRLPRPAQPPLQAWQQLIPSAAALEASGLEALHRQGFRGQGIRLAIIDSDFRGYERFLKSKPNIHLVDLTSERNADLIPDTFPGPPEVPGRGTQCAMVAAQAAPQAEFVLIRVDQESPVLLEAAARLIHGLPYRSDNLTLRYQELADQSERLRTIRQDYVRARQQFLDFFGRDADPTKYRESLLKSPEEFEKEVNDRRAALDQMQAQLQAEERSYTQRQDRILALERDYRGLNGIDVACSSLVWNDGYPLGGASALAHFFDREPFRKTLWLQAAGDIRGQVWSGPFLDADDNGVLEFAPPTMPLPPRCWTRELSFLGWQQPAERPAAELPAKTRCRLSIQWREPHDPEFFLDPSDPYRQPLANLSLLVLRQRDPSGTRLATDDMELVARSDGPPQRISNQPDAATYEQRLEFEAEAAGRYAVRVEGRVPLSIRPPAAPLIPAIQRFWELRPRLFVAGAAATAGRIVFLDYATDEGTLGLPAGARELFTVGAAQLSGQPEPRSSVGPPLDRALLLKPNLLGLAAAAPGVAQNQLAADSSAAAAFSAGLTATLLSAGMPAPAWEKMITDHPSVPLRVPPDFQARSPRHPRPTTTQTGP